jgi:hypothetical protein
MSQPSTSVAAAPRAVGASGAAPAPGLIPTPVPQPEPTSGSAILRRLNLLLVGAVVGSILFGVIGCAMFAWQTWSLGRAEAGAAQLIRVQQIQTSLLSADATATNAFLVGGLEPASQRAAYDRSVATVGTLVAEAARAQPADAPALAALNEQVIGYAGAVEQARANNRQGLPVGAQYLRAASTELRAGALPILSSLVQANAQRASQAMDAPAALIIFTVVGLALLALLVLALFWVARTFKRTLNPGLLAATSGVLLTLVIGGIALNGTNTRINELQAGSFSRLTLGAQARIEANNAKANESLTLIARGSGGSFEKEWQDSAARVDTSLTSSRGFQLAELWQDYTQAHRQIRTLDDGGRWDAAVQLATGAGASSANRRFAAFDAATTSFVDEMAGLTREGLQRPQTPLIIGAVLVLLAGLVAALLARQGLVARLREYR